MAEKTFDDPTPTPAKIAPVYVVLSGEMQLEAPPSRAYLHVLNYPSWQNYSAVEHVSGNPGEEGELVVLRKEEKGFTFPPYYSRTIKLEPGRRLIWKTYPAEKGKEGDFFGIVDFKLYPESAKARFCYDVLYEFQVPYRLESDLDSFRREQYRNFEALLASVFPKLKLLVASDA